MKANVMDQILLWIVQRGVHLRDFLSQRCQMFWLRVLRSQAGQSYFEQLPRLEHFVRCELMKVGKNAQGLTVERGRTFSDISARTVARAEHPDGAKKAQPM